ncbi:MAG: response regulator transcription factor [Bacteroidales bacterium]|nr:response regulator transcription factor [Bacteroidales bacterium]MCF8455842.1 response regulator transcription factor [Bacteroidales bacterium]
MNKILIVEDDINAGVLLCDNLVNEGFQTSLVKDGFEGWKKFSDENFDLCILDIMLPKLDGVSLAKKIRKIEKDTPIIFLSARNLDYDKIEGFEAGCDDYVTKPFNIKELILRIHAILRRNKNNKCEDINEFQVSHTNFKYLDRLLTIGDSENKLSTKEADVIKILFENQNEIISRSYILETVWGKDDYYASQCLDVYLTKVRRYLSSDEAILIQNIHGFGYKLIVKEE